jgi:hypothetical protein
LNFVHFVLLAARFIYLLILNKHLTSKLQVSPNFTLDSVADSNYRGKCDVGGFLIFEWTLGIEGLPEKFYLFGIKMWQFSLIT